MNKIRALSALMVAAYGISAVIPEEWSKQAHVGAMPLDCIILAFICSLLCIDLFGSTHALSPELIGGICGLTLMATYGYIRGNIDMYSLKFFAADVYYFAAYLSGLAFGLSRDRPSQARMVACIAWIAAIGIAANYAALFAGLVGTSLALPAGRQTTTAIFGASGMLLILIPWASVVSSQRHPGWKGPRLFTFFALSAVTVLLAGNRSGLLAILFVLLLCGILSPQSLNRRLIPPVLLGLCLLVLLLTSGLPIFETVLFQRLATQGLLDESRSTEVAMMWDQISGDLALGQGMGSRFISDVIVEGDPLASAPHIGILTFLMKGGALAFLAYAIAPVPRAVRVLFSSKSLKTQRGAAASMLVYVALACTSGGWNPATLFLYGLATSAIGGRADDSDRLAPPGVPAPSEMPA